MAGFTPLSFRPAHVGLLAAAVLSGCALNNPPPVDMGSTAPVTAVAIAPPAQAVSNSGSLYQASRYRPVFENRRARMVGDTVMVQIVEKVAASQKQSSNVNRSNEMSGSVSRLPFLAGSTNDRITPRLGIGLENESQFSGGGGTSSANTSDVNSCPIGKPAKATPISDPTRFRAKEGLRAVGSSDSRRVILSDCSAISFSNDCNSRDFSLSSTEAMISIG